MTTTDFTTTILVNETPEKVYNAINNVAGWWWGDIKGSATRLNDEFTYQYEEIHFSKQKVIEMIPGKKIAWLVTDSSINFVDNKNEWTGTSIHFDLLEQDGKTSIHFTHAGLLPEIECFDNCSNAWNQLIQQSLVSFITTGKGKNVFSE